MQMFKKLAQKPVFRKLFNRETISYLIFGVLTTLVNLAVFWLMDALLGSDSKLIVLINNAVAFVAAVLFAYVTNKIFVFQSRSWSAKTLSHEIPAFFGARLFSFGIEELLLLFSLGVLHADEYMLQISRFSLSGVKVAKIVISVVTVILNYFFSKLFIFKKGKDTEG